jgi:hypothetical protein
LVVLLHAELHLVLALVILIQPVLLREFAKEQTLLVLDHLLLQGLFFVVEQQLDPVLEPNPLLVLNRPLELQLHLALDRN